MKTRKEVRIWLTDNAGNQLDKETLKRLINNEFNLFLNMEVHIEHESIIKKVKRNICICNWWTIKDVAKYIKNFVKETEAMAVNAVNEKTKKYKILKKYL